MESVPKRRRYFFPLAFLVLLCGLYKSPSEVMYILQRSLAFVRWLFNLEKDNRGIVPYYKINDLRKTDESSHIIACIVLNSVDALRYIVLHMSLSLSNTYNAIFELTIDLASCSYWSVCQFFLYGSVDVLHNSIISVHYLMEAKPAFKPERHLSYEAQIFYAVVWVMAVTTDGSFCTWAHLFNWKYIHRLRARYCF